MFDVFQVHYLLGPYQMYAVSGLNVWWVTAVQVYSERNVFVGGYLMMGGVEMYQLVVLYEGQRWSLPV